MACGSTANHGNPGQPSTGGTDASAGSAQAGAGAGGMDTGVAGNEPDAGGEGGETEGAPRDRVELVRDKVPNKLDLLMMIDNSVSMGDKQHLLADAMQHLVSRLLQPKCLDELGTATGKHASPGGICPGGSQPEFLPFNDIHAAVVTSSLGSRGAVGPSDVCTTAEADDHGQLLGVIRPNLPSWNQQGFLAWDPKQALSPVGIADPAVFAAAMASTVQAAGDSGCGYESALEGWYRFLVDPEPPAGVVVPQGSKQSTVTGTSAEVLAQRKAFLRSDSVLAIVMLSDENDCSIVDQGLSARARYG